jgi:hypothetical protein
MRFKTLAGREKDVNVTKYRIDWEPAREVSKPQAKVKKFLRPYWSGHLVLEEMVLAGTRMRADLTNISRRIIVEVSPAQHLEYNEFFHRGSKLNFVAALKRDLDKKKWAELNGFTFVEIFDEDLDVLNRKWFLDKYDITL